MSPGAKYRSPGSIWNRNWSTTKKKLWSHFSTRFFFLLPSFLLFCFSVKSKEIYYHIFVTVKMSFLPTFSFVFLALFINLWNGSALNNWFIYWCNEVYINEEFQEQYKSLLHELYTQHYYGPIFDHTKKLRDEKRN